jgi:endonuclease YncB( thermonuclease family)
MKKRRAQFRVLGVVLTTLVAVGIPSAQAPDRLHGPLTVRGPVRVIEGDTLEVSINGMRVGVRIPGITVPRGNTPCGRQASAAMRELLSSGALLDDEIRLSPRDNRGLSQLRVTNAAGRAVAAELAAAGLAIADSANENAADFPEILAAQSNAQNARRGCVWADDSGAAR